MSGSSPAPAALESALGLVDRVAPVPPALARRALDEVAAALPLLAVRQHPLGFMHVDLEPVSGRAGARLHVWTGTFLAGADTLGRLHDHVWELRSAVLAGRLVDHVLEPEPAPLGEHRAYRVRYGPKGNALEPLPGRWSLRESAARERGRGQSYALAPGLVHRTEIVDLPTATLVLAVAVLGDRGGPSVYVPHGQGPGRAADRPPVPRGAALRAIEQAKQALDE